jgi:NADH-quinone oxidoreductase subunit J
MELQAIVFYIFAFITIGSAFIVVFSRNIMYSVFSLLFTFFGVAGLYVLLHADFLAVTQILIYVGGILVLLLFGVMLTNRVVSVDIKTSTVQTVPALLVVAVVAGSLSGMFYSTFGSAVAAPVATTTTTPALGELLLTTYLLPFEIASVLLLVALIGAALMSRRDRIR